MKIEVEVEVEVEVFDRDDERQEKIRRVVRCLQRVCIDLRFGCLR